MWVEDPHIHECLLKPPSPEPFAAMSSLAPSVEMADLPIGLHEVAALRVQQQPASSQPLSNSINACTDAVSTVDRGFVIVMPQSTIDVRAYTVLASYPGSL